MAAKYVLRKSEAGFHFNLLGTNGKIIASSEVYNTKQAAKNGIESVRRNAADAELVDESPGRGRPAASAPKAAPARRVTKRPAKATRSVKASKPAKAMKALRVVKVARAKKAGAATRRTSRAAKAKR